MGRGLLSLAAVMLVTLALGACDTSTGEDETEPTFEQAQAIAEEQLADAGCEFQVEDESSEGREQKSLDCLLTERGTESLYPVFTYERDLEEDEVDQYFGGFTTADRYFQNGNITVDPAGGDPTAPQLDAEEFATAIQNDCGCGEVLTPEE